MATAAVMGEDGYLVEAPDELAGAITYATQEEAESGVDTEHLMNPLRTAQAIAAQGGGGGSGNIDGGTPSSNYGGTTGIDGGTP